MYFVAIINSKFKSLQNNEYKKMKMVL